MLVGRMPMLCAAPYERDEIVELTWNILDDLPIFHGRSHGEGRTLADTVKTVADANRSTGTSKNRGSEVLIEAVAVTRDVGNSLFIL